MRCMIKDSPTKHHTSQIEQHYTSERILCCKLNLRQEQNRQSCLRKARANVCNHTHYRTRRSKRVTGCMRHEFEEETRQRRDDTSCQVQADKLFTSKCAYSTREAMQHIHVGEEMEGRVVRESRQHHWPADSFRGWIWAEIAQHQRFESWNAPQCVDGNVESQNGNENFLARR